MALQPSWPGDKGARPPVRALPSPWAGAFATRLSRTSVGLVGYALILARPDVVSGGAGFDIHHLFDAEWRRRAGICRALIAAARGLGLAAGAECLTISALLDNQGAVAACRAMGLEELPWHGVRFKVA